MGEEPYYIDLITNYISENVLKEEEKAFNQTVLYGKDCDAAAIINAAKRFPMMAPYQVVIIKEAQEVKDIEKLEYYLSQPLNSTILVLNYKYKKLDKRKKLYKELDKKGILFESKKIYENQLPEWIQNYLGDKGYNIQPPAALLIAEFLGADLQKIAKELDKLMILTPVGETITTTHIEDNIGISKDFNTFELQKAVVNRDALKAFRIVEHFGANPNQYPFVVTVTSLYFFFSKVLMYHALKDKSRQSVASALKVNPYFVVDYQNAARNFPLAKSEQVISLLREYDLKAKGVNNATTPHSELLRELVYKLIN